MDDHAVKSAQNYELLIRVDEKLLNLTREMRDMSVNFSGQLASLNTAKFDKEEAARHERSDGKIHEDFENRLRIVEQSVNQLITRLKTWGAVLGVGLAILQIVLKFL